MAKKIISFLPSIIWMIFIFYLSSQQTSGIKGSYTQRFIILKFFHLIEYAVLFFSYRFATKSTPKSFVLGYLYAISDEIHQSFIPGRNARITDTFIDLFGMSLGYFAYYLISKLKNSRLY